jgi:mono/diheme cytochrome c family protein
MCPKLILGLFLLFPLVCTVQSQKSSGDPQRSARIPVEGAAIFQRQCAPCHGMDGRGHGPESTRLKQSLPDLTLISQRNGGKFPFEQTKKLIAGKQSAPVHGNREMPLWGPIFHQVEADQDWGEVRLDAITRQVESIQQK